MPRNWQGGQRPVDVFTAKADALAVLEAAGAQVQTVQVVAEAPCSVTVVRLRGEAAPERAEAMLRGLKGFPLLDGFRGADKADLGAVAAAVAAFSALVAAAGERIAEAEINPLIAGPWGCLAVDGLVRCGSA